MVFCDNLEWWDWVGGEEKAQEKGDMYTYDIQQRVWQNPTQYCKAIILQLKVNLKKLYNAENA